MTTKMMKTLLFVVLPLLISAASSSVWPENETASTYVEFPSDLWPRLNAEWAVYQEDVTLPEMRVFQDFPTDSNLWPLLKPLTRRLHPLLWPRVHYFMHDGESFECRIDGNYVETHHCHRHCLYEGRYCLDHAEHWNGRDVLKEIVRRLCLDQVYHSKDPRFVDYVQAFETLDCLSPLHSSVRNCSLTAMDTVGLEFPKLEQCLLEDRHDDDVAHPTLDRNMRHLKQHQVAKKDDYPLVTIQDDRFDTSILLTSQSLFRNYCDSFPSERRPLACQLCQDCRNVRTCLWTLKCDDKDFSDPTQIPPDFLSLPEEMTAITSTTTSQEVPVQEGTAPPSSEVAVEAQERPVSTIITQSPDETQENAAGDTIQTQSRQENKGAGGTIFLIIFLVLVTLSFGLAGYLYYQRNQKMSHDPPITKRKSIVANLLGKLHSSASIFTNDHNHDHDAELGDRAQDDYDYEAKSDFHRKAKQLLEEGRSVRHLHSNEPELFQNEGEYKDDPYRDHPEEDDQGIIVEDLLDEESERIEQRSDRIEQQSDKLTESVLC